MHRVATFYHGHGAPLRDPTPAATVGRAVEDASVADAQPAALATPAQSGRPPPAQGLRHDEARDAARAAGHEPARARRGGACFGALQLFPGYGFVVLTRRSPGSTWTSPARSRFFLLAFNFWGNKAGLHRLNAALEIRLARGLKILLLSFAAESSFGRRFRRSTPLALSTTVR